MVILDTDLMPPDGLPNLIRHLVEYLLIAISRYRGPEVAQQAAAQWGDVHITYGFQPEGSRQVCLEE